ncbi:hypothetical protein BGZ97_008365 [Linnemannia gamsii]|uniref:glycerophosphodiester phosphodiesterase n=1 Tax=Linnemannia gamsii TaxID=64522 RepID=A0A9P6QNF0_9FUNG|nr:hypothetical protein BGZ97_008365 [Linnemannia gamsii]
MHILSPSVLTALLAGLLAASQVTASSVAFKGLKPIKQVQLGPRPYYLVDNLEDGPLKKKLASCMDKNMKTSSWSIAHRGGSLQFPEHSRESYMAAARMGAGVLECDVAFTKDRELVCRHSQCDLHTTTNIVNIPELNAKCTTPFSPAKDGKPAEHLALTHALGLKHTPELKTPEVKMPFEGDYTQKKYAQQMIDTIIEARVNPKDVFLQSFLYDDILYWLKAAPAFGKQALYLDNNGDAPGSLPSAVANLKRYAKDGVKYIAPPINYLVANKNGTIVPSSYAQEAKKLGLKIITWSLERSGPIADVHKSGNFYYSPIQEIVTKDGDIFHVLDVLWRKVGVAGVFSDWAATTTYYANCFGIGLKK